ncbi:MAG: 16S rRNA (cytosine(1402)-N(4))-methyltransferase RsmH [Chloroflexota bacterium]|nr:16S rRNA (cytosine(1402)-N(4))-methyltransferase RsmH [Chloroflexota bacterium]
MSAIATAVQHIPVLLEETVELLNVRPGGKYIDCTVGCGGHATAILQASSPNGKLLGLDIDPSAIEEAHNKLSPFGDAVVLVNDSYKNMEQVCAQNNFSQVQGILLDLGVSSLQLDNASRGFSFQHDAPLDMRFSPNTELTAADIVNTFPESELATILRKYGEEPKSRPIAKRIVANRPIHSTVELARLVEQTLGHTGSKIHPATKTFQALRITVNHELECLRDSLKQAVHLLAPGGRLVIIAYHSLESRVVKEFLRQEARGCVCAPGIPVCICEHVPTLKLITKKVIKPSSREIEANHRSRSGRLRAAEHL